MFQSVYGVDVVTLKTVYKWYESIEDEQRSGRPLTPETNQTMVRLKRLFSVSN